jgi:hypothetical protein
MAATDAIAKGSVLPKRSKKIGSRGRIISVEKSVRKLLTPRAMMFC